MSLATKISALSTLFVSKLNFLKANKEETSNKKQDLSGANANHYPSVPAVNAGLTATEASAKNYTDNKFDSLPDDLVSDPNYVHTDNNYTTAEKNKLAGLESSHYKGTFTSLGALNTAFPDGIPGDYADVDPGAGDPAVRFIWDDNDEEWIAQVGASTQLTGAQIKQMYEAQPDTNAFTDNDKTNLDANTAHRGKTDNPHNVTKAQVGLSAVNNTSDANKPVSTAQAAAIAVVQDELDDYQLEVGENFPDYAAQATAALDF